jgi:hypothetical protein
MSFHPGFVLSTYIADKILKIYKSVVVPNNCQKLFILTVYDKCGINSEKNPIKRIFNSVQKYFADHKMPSRVYKFLLDTLREDNYKLADDLLYRSIDTLETTDD